MVIESSLVDNWGVIEGEIRFFDEIEAIRSLENQLRRFKEGQHYLISIDNHGGKTYTIYSDKLKRCIAEIGEIDLNSRLLRGASKIGNIMVKVYDGRENATFSNQEAGSLEDIFLRNRATRRARIREESNIPSSSRISEIVDDSNARDSQYVEQQHPIPARVLNYEEWLRIGRQMGWLAIVTLFSFLKFLL